MKKIVYILISILLITTSVYGQQRVSEEGLKRQAIRHMQAGRYGEAIDLLHKYVTYNAREAEGYNLRGLCYEARKEYQFAVLDFRRAHRLDPADPEIKKNLDRALKDWHEILYKKIEGHKREIAIDPTDPVNYLEIGKSYRWLEEWAIAETWYDRYLELDPYASPDEMIRYTEILSHTGSITKGERWLRIYVDRHPDDWRLWSRYGYFTMWLGNYRNAENAFENALSFKPFFQEAQDGLDLARREGYLVQQTPRSFEREYPIDSFYGRLKKDPDNAEIRYQLIDSLMVHERYEEAMEQLNYLQADFSDSDDYNDRLDKLTTIRDSVYSNQVEVYTKRVKQDPNDAEAVQKLADYYARLYYYDDALEILSEFLEDKPEDSYREIRFDYARYAAWNFEWERAIEQLDMLLELEPDNLDYQLLRGQISVWTVLDLDEAKVLLENVHERQPENLSAIVALTSLYSWQKDFDTAKRYLDMAKNINPNNSDVLSAESNYFLHVSAYEELQTMQIKAEAGELAMEGDCEEAVYKYDEYLAQITGPTRQEKIEYADINSCAQNFTTAIDIYDELLAEEYDYDLALRRAQNHYWNEDTLMALEQFEELVEEEPDNFMAKLYLGDSYFRVKEYGRADDMYDELMDEASDTSQINMVERRREWMPPLGLEAGIHSVGDFLSAFIPTNIGIAPTANYYGDNQDFDFYNIGTRVDMGLLRYFNVGASIMRSHLNSDQEVFDFERNLTTFRWLLSVHPVRYFSVGGSFGEVTTLGFEDKDVYDIYARYQIPDTMLISASYERNDTRLVIYSPDLLNISLDSDVYRLGGFYKPGKSWMLRGNYNYIKNSDNNKGNDFLFRFGKQFFENGYVGYEYYFSDYAFVSAFYYSPQEFNSHSLWAEWTKQYKENIKLMVGGKIGYVPDSDFVLNEIFADARYNPFLSLILSGRLTYGTSFRYDSSYNFFSASFSAYWSIY